MAPLLPILPALLTLTTTIVGAATAKDPPTPLPSQQVVPDVDQELRDAMKRKGRQRFVNAGDTLAGSDIGSQITLGQGATILGE